MSAVDLHKPRLLMSAFACRPNAGSEPGIGWHRALNAARDFETWVLCDEEENRAAVEQYLAANGDIPNLHFVFVSRNALVGRLLTVSGFYYLNYNLWHRRAYRVARRMHREMRFDLVHQANLCGFREPGYLWRLDAPLIWGPIGGAQNFPRRFLRGIGLAGAVNECVRTFVNNFQLRFSRRVGIAARRAKIVLAATTVNSNALAPRCRTAPQVMLETGIHPPADLPPRDFQHNGPLRLLWSGVFEHRKALHLLFDALAELPSDTYELRILGKGPLEKRLVREARRLGIDRNCQWLGWVKHREALELFRWADALVFTSLRDTSGNVVLEALANGTPVVCLDHQGMADMITPECGKKLPVTNPADVIHALRDTLRNWFHNRGELDRLSAGAFRRAQYYSWENQNRRMAQVYQTVLCAARADRRADHYEIQRTHVDPPPAGSSEPVAQACGVARV